MFTTKCACAFPNENDYPARFAIAAILPQTEDVYEPSPGIWTHADLSGWRNWRKKSSKSLEQIAVLVAMAQHQAQVVDLSACQSKDPRLDIFEVLSLHAAVIQSSADQFQPFLIVPDDQNVRIIRAQIPRQVLHALASPTWSQSLQKLPHDVCIRVEQSVPLDTRQDDGLLTLLSAMEAILRRYDEMKSLLALPPAPQKQALQSEEKYASPQATPSPDRQVGSSSERGRLRTRRADPPHSGYLCRTESVF